MSFWGKNKIWIFVLAGILIFGTAAYFIFSHQNSLTSDQVLVTQVIDGDTIVVQGGEHVRLIGIDADEKNYPCYDPAKSRLTDLVLNKEVKLEADEQDLGPYGRSLRYVFLDQKNINFKLIQEGLVIAEFIQPNFKYQEKILAAQEEAKENKVGCEWEQESKLIQACSAKEYSGQKVILRGKIVDSHYDSASQTVFLNFGSDYPEQCFTGVIFKSSLNKFVDSPEEYYLNKTVQIQGKVKEYQNKPEIILESPDQIKIQE